MSSFDFKDAEIRSMKIEELKPAEYNPRKINKKSFKGLGKSIDNFGLMVPIVWNQQSGNIVGGHQRYHYLVDEGAEETDVVVVDLDHNEEVALNIALNSPKIRGQFTDEAVALLKLTEARIGSAFGELRLFELHEEISKRAQKAKNTLSGSGGSDGSGGSGGSPPDKQIPVVTCPKCKSKWNMENNRVISDNSSEEETDV